VEGEVIRFTQVNLTDGDVLGDFWRELRVKLRETGIELADVDVVVRKKS